MVVGQDSKRLSGSVQVILRFRLRTGTLSPPSHCISQSKSQDWPGFKGGEIDTNRRSYNVTLQRGVPIERRIIVAIFESLFHRTLVLILRDSLHFLWHQLLKPSSKWTFSSRKPSLTIELEFWPPNIFTHLFCGLCIATHGETLSHQWWFGMTEGEPFAILRSHQELRPHLHQDTNISVETSALMI